MSKIDEIIKNFDKKTKDIINSFKEELKKIRTGRVSTALVEDVMVEVSGTKMPLKSLGSINVVGPRQLSVQPWDSSYLKAIERALQEKNLGLVKIQENLVYLSLPELTQEYREKLIKELKVVKEQTREKIRKERDEVLKDIQTKEKEKQISETDKFKGKEKVDEITKESNEKIEEIYKQKEQEITSL